MAGTETARFDFGVQFSELAWNDLLGPIFDEGGVVGELVDLLFGFAGDPDFTFTVSLDRPTDVAIPADAENPLDLNFAFSVGGFNATVRIVVGVVVDRSNATVDELVVDFDNELYHRRARINGGGVQFSDADVQRVFRPIRIPVGVTRGTDNPGLPERLDVKVVDDTTTADRDATALMISFGGSTGGDLAALRSFVPDGGRGAIGIFFQWIARMAAPNIEDALGMDRGSFTITDTAMTFAGRVRIDDDEEVDLTAMSMRLVDGAIDVSASVEKSGFCYTASGDVGASILLEIRDGRLIADPEISDPVIDLDIPLLCYIAGAAIGALLGGVLFGIADAIIGAILVPLIMWLASEVLTGVVDGIADSVVDAINNALPATDTPLPGIDIVFQRVFIDDVVIDAGVVPLPGGTLRGEGTVRLRPGQGFDLDAAAVVTADVRANADIEWRGAGEGRRLRPGCGARLARTGRRDFASIARYALYGLAYAHDTAVPVGELGVLTPAGLLHETFGDGFLGGLLGDDVRAETMLVYAIDTDEDRYAIVQAVSVEDEDVVLRWRCFDRRAASLAIDGDFVCQPDPRRPDAPPVVVFEPDEPPVITVTPGGAAPVTPTVTATRASKATAAATLTPVQRTVIAQLRDRDPKRPIVAIGPQPAGQWVARVPGRQAATARLHARVSGLRPEVAIAWWLDGEPLQGDSGRLDHDGTRIDWQREGDATLVVTVDADAVLDLQVRVTATGGDGTQLTQRRCLHRDGTCPLRLRFVPALSAFRALRGVPLARIAEGGVGVTPHGEVGAVVGFDGGGGIGYEGGGGLRPAARRRTGGLYLPADAAKAVKPKAKRKKTS